jgi:hypothetical protein
MATARILHLAFIDGDNQELKPRQSDSRVKDSGLAELPISVSINEND